MKSCIFDLDGTLINTLPTVLHYNNLSLTHFGFHEITERECQNLCRLSIADFYSRLLELGGCPPEQISEMTPAIRDYDIAAYQKNYLYLSTPYKGLNELLKRLHEKGIRTAVLTNKPASVAESLIAELFPDLFDLVRGQTPYTISKPDPRSLWNLLDDLQADLEQCLYVGDTDVDVTTARNAGAEVAAVTWGFQPMKILKTFHPDYIVKDPSEILSLF